RLVVNLVLIEGGNLFIVERIGRSDACIDDVALVQLQLHIAGDRLLSGIHKGGEGLAQGGVPLAVVNQIGKLQSHLLLVVISLLIQAQLFQLVVSVVENGTAGSFVHATGL